MYQTHFSGLIKPDLSGKHGRITVNGIQYTKVYSRWQEMLLKVVKKVQSFLWKHRIAVHDPIFGECTPDFNCCVKIGVPATIRISQENLNKLTFRK